MNRKALQLAISTLILIILGILVLIGLAYFLTDGFKTLKSSSQPFLDTTTSSSIKSACSLACSQSDKITFCCREYDLDDSKIKCADERLELNCNLDCANFQCGVSVNLNKCENSHITIATLDGLTTEVNGRLIEGKECPLGTSELKNIENMEAGKICCYPNS